MDPTGIRCAVPSRVGVGESFDIRIKVLGPIIAIPCRGQFKTLKPGLGSPFNLNVERGIQYHDNCLPEWSGSLDVDGGDALSGRSRLVFDGVDQGVFPSDRRPIKRFPGYSFDKPGIHFVRVVDAESGVEGVSNPICVTVDPPVDRIYWGDPHWQTFFSDGIRCPEELYAFARDEAFLDFGAISDHMEALTDRQWDYFQAVTNDFNEPGRFVTLQGQEWTHHDKAAGAPGHRNVYYRGDHGPVLRSTDPACDSLEKLWRALDALPNDIEAIAIPHHSANVVMGVDWEQGWNPRYEKAVEIYSIWGSSERHEDKGNTLPIRSCQGEMHGRHVIDALKLGYRMGFVGGGDIHDGRPGDAMHGESYPEGTGSPYHSGFTAVSAASLTRENVFDAIRDQQTYATTERGIYLDVAPGDINGGMSISLTAASQDGVVSASVVHNGEDMRILRPDADPRVLREDNMALDMAPGDFAYLRVVTGKGNIAWSSPLWG